MPSSPHSPHPLTATDWTLLSADLEFLYVDPVLHAHLGPQANAIVGRRLLDFVHPDEHASAQQDLRKVLQSRTLHGSVTRVRYSRLARTRARLGFSGVHLAFPDEDKVSFDDDYMACDLVINWAAEGLVLCFIHAIVGPFNLIFLLPPSLTLSVQTCPPRTMTRHIALIGQIGAAHPACL